ncbi:hypothetical protein [Pseudomonas sp. TMP9]|uniref:hypothetical protein n=1 Tax=Pseudomonas sp. TMP9 TaxID=3133144 RepID=UPI0030CF94D8
MHSEEERLARLADKVVEGMSSQPLDEQPAPQAGIKIKANSGNINFGNQYNIGTLSVGGGRGSGDGCSGNVHARQLHQWSVAELKATLAHYRAQWWSGFRGYWLNIPCVLMLALLFGVAGSLFAGVLPIREPQHMWLVLAPTVLAMLGLSFWLTHIRRIEGRVMAESRATIDAIRTEIRKRR